MASYIEDTEQARAYLQSQGSHDNQYMLMNELEAMLVKFEDEGNKTTGTIASTEWKFNIPKEITEKGLGYYKDKYEEIASSRIAQIEAAAEGYYPDRWDFVKLDKSGYEAVKEQIAAHMQARDTEDVDECAVATHSIYRLTIHFPSITITNSRGNSHVVKDVYIMLNFDYKLKLSEGLKGYRGTKTIREYMHMYNHSHGERASRGIVAFCLGSTPFETIVTTARTSNFDIVVYELILQNLLDYLSWESEEGGPYVRMASLANPASSSATPPEIASAELVRITQGVIANREPLRYSIRMANGEIGVALSDDLSFREMLTKYTSTSWKFPYVEHSLNSVYSKISEQETISNVRRINAMVTPCIMYKGRPIKQVVEETKDISEGPERETLVESRMAVHVRRELERAILDFIRRDFLYGHTQKESQKDAREEARA